MKLAQDELFSIFKSEQSLRMYGIRWLGHVFRREDAYPAKKLTFSKTVDTRPATKWLDREKKRFEDFENE